MLRPWSSLALAPSWRCPGAVAAWPLGRRGNPLERFLHMLSPDQSPARL